ncbi:hypothetical protein AGMMS4957_06320 [Bacteroidia bacterium]|nr:hypothetical protein AGMMS4957_06320 [Bacteroidia bacterium]
MNKLFIERKTLLAVFSVVMGAFILSWMINFFTEPADTQPLVLVAFDEKDSHFKDFFEVLAWDANRDPYFDVPAAYGREHAAIYLPLPLLLFYPLSCLDDYASMSFRDAASGIGMLSVTFFTCISLICLFLALYKLGKSRKSALLIWGLLFFSSVSLTAIDAGNFIILSAACITTFLLFYDSPSKGYRNLALVCLTVASVLKIYPVLFGVFLLFDKKYKSIGICVVLGLALTFLPFLFFHHSVSENISQLILNLASASDNTGQVFAFAYASWGLPNVVAHVVEVMKLPEGLVAVSWYIQLLLAVISIILCFFTKNNWLRIGILSIVVMIVPDRSLFYCGLYFFPAIVVFFNRQTFTLKDWMYVLLFCVFLNPAQVKYAIATSNMAILLIWGLLLIDVLKEVKPGWLNGGKLTFAA